MNKPKSGRKLMNETGAANEPEKCNSFSLLQFKYVFIRHVFVITKEKEHVTKVLIYYFNLSLKNKNHTMKEEK